MTEWTKDKEKKVLFKYRFTLTVKIIRVIAAILFIWMIYMIAVNFIYEKTDVDKKHIFYSNIAMEWRNPIMTGMYSGLEKVEISPFLTQKMTYPLFRIVGKERQYTGELNLNRRLITSFSTSEIINNGQGPDQNNYFNFYLPERPEDGGKLPAPSYSDVWKTLDVVHEGTVADLAFSTDKFMKIEDLLQLLKPFDIDILWLSLYTGEYKAFSPNAFMEGEATSVEPFGLAGASKISDDYLSMERINLSVDHVDELRQWTLSNMEYFLKNEKQNYYELALGLDHLQERYDYLLEHGFQVYGAVVTGPVKELLKLKDVEEIRGVQLGKLEYWNWDN